MISFLLLIENNLGLSIINLLAIIFNLGLIIFMAKDFRTGLIMMFIINSCLFLLAYSQNWDYSLVLPITLLSVGLLSLSLWSNNKYSSGVA